MDDRKYTVIITKIICYFLNLLILILYVCYSIAINPLKIGCEQILNKWSVDDNYKVLKILWYLRWFTRLFRS